MRALRHLCLCGFSILASCGPEPSRDSPAIDAAFKKGFKSPIVDREGKRIGSAVGTVGQDGLVVSFEVSGLAPGDHGIHLHSTGRCDPPSFASAGPHWDVSGKQHGHDNPQGAHDGDWGNLTIFPTGKGSTDRLIPRWHSRIPETGLALVIHAGKDDEVTDPDGKSGERIACAVVIPSG
jgi:Cu-Zn family superoxide dismutase